MLFMRNQDAYLYQNKINNLELLFACVIQYIRKALYIHSVVKHEPKPQVTQAVAHWVLWSNGSKFKVLQGNLLE